MRVAAALACLLSALALASAAGATTFGVADDAGKYADDGGASFFAMVRDLGMTENRIAVFWDPARPDTIVDQEFLDRAVPVARRYGIDVMFSIYPLKARALVDTPNGIEQFAAYAARVARRYPQVTKIICLNEGNQPRFHQPQFDDAGNGISGAVQERAMAACYDALKAVNPGIDVIAFGVSPRGNDDFDAESNVSHSPVRFLKEVGDAYRASGRTRPIADDVAFHCYPNSNKDAPTVGYAWPKIGCVNLDRLKQSWWDAFHGTPQPLFQEANSSGGGPYVRIFVDEVGYQTEIPAQKSGLYSGRENVPLIDEATQASYYAQLIAMMACDPGVALLNFFHAVDEGNLAAWQSGVVHPDGSPRASYAAVRDATSANRDCRGTRVSWQHTERVVGAAADFAKLSRSFAVRAEEGFAYEVSVLRGKRTLTGVKGDGREHATTTFKLPRLPRGTYKLVVRLTAETSAQRTSTFTKRFRVR